MNMMKRILLYGCVSLICRSERRNGVLIDTGWIVEYFKLGFYFLPVVFLYACKCINYHSLSDYKIWKHADWEQRRKEPL